MASDVVYLHARWVHHNPADAVNYFLVVRCCYELADPVDEYEFLEADNVLQTCLTTIHASAPTSALRCSLFAACFSANISYFFGPDLENISKRQRINLGKFAASTTLYKPALAEHLWLTINISSQNLNRLNLTQSTFNHGILLPHHQ
jgi:hypothetical protein